MLKYIVIIFVVSFCVNCNSFVDVKDNVARSVSAKSKSSVCCNNNSNDEIDVGSKSIGYNGDLQGVVIAEDNLAKNESLGKIWLKFEVPNKYQETKIEVPAEAMTELNLYFQSYLEFCKNKPKSAQEGVDKDRNITKQTVKVINQITEIEIESPNGIRNISMVEADRLIRFVVDSAINLCNSNEMSL